MAMAAEAMWNSEEWTVDTKDLWLSAFLLSERALLSDVRVQRINGKREAVFFLTGKNVLQLQSDYRAGIAKSNVMLLQRNLKYLKDIIFREVGLVGR